MHLVTTQESDQENIKDKKLYLTDWSRKDIYLDEDKLNILPYHWKNLDSVKKEATFLYNFFEEALNTLSLELDRYNSSNFGLKYWKILIGPWLYYFLTKYYDHYKSIEEALKLDKQLNINITREHYIPHTYYGYGKLNGNNLYTSLICEEILECIDNENKIKKNVVINTIIKNLNFIEHEKNKEAELKIIRLDKKNSINILKENIKKIINTLIYGKSKNLITILSLASKNQNELIKKISLNKFTVFQSNLYKIFFKFNPKCKVDYDFRSRKIDINVINNFKELFYKNLLKHIPVEYLENFSHNRKIIKKVFSKNTKLAIIRTPLDFKTFNRFYLSEVINNKGKILSMQHGGAYGARDIIGTEKLEIELSDKYLTWGWKSKSKNAHTFYVTKDFWIKNYNYNQMGDILFIGASCKNFFYSFDEGQLPNHSKYYIKNAVKFINQLNKISYSNLVYRFYHQDNFNEYSYIKKFFQILELA